MITWPQGSAAAVFTALSALSALSALPCAAQIRASERAVVQQTVDGTTITVDYARPRLRGRTAIFGGEVKWEEVWTPGANEATTLRSNRDFFLNGHPVPAGKYSVWLQVKEKGDWIFMLHADTLRQHFMHPKIDAGRLSFAVTPERDDTAEVLTWSFPSVTHEGATLELRWSTMRVPVQIRVTPTLRRTIAEADAAPYVGDYEMEWTWSSGKKNDMRIRYNAADSTLRAETRMGSMPWDVMLTPAADGAFIPIIMFQGQPGEAAETLVFEFSRENGRPAAFEVRDSKTDALQGKGRRKGG
jgi:hypothetical protein